MSVVEEIESVIKPALENRRFELVETQYRREAGHWVLRLFIDKMEAAGAETGARPSVTLDDCEQVSELVGGILDASPVLQGAYTLEVSSPGINRPLKNEPDFRRFLGQKVKVSLFAPLWENSKQKNFAGPLLSCGDQAIEVDDVVSGKVKIPLSAVAKAHLDLI